jgi:DnaJ-domain-containing protein 1
VSQPVQLAEERYFEMLELAVADGSLSGEESAALNDLAVELGVSPGELNRRFVESLATGAKADGAVTSAEADEVYRTARLLGISESDVARMLEIDRADVSKCHLSLSEGSPVCFLGEFDLEVMARLVQVASDRKFKIRKNITGTVEAVVVGKPDSELKRQSRAKALGIPVVTVSDFMDMVKRPFAPPRAVRA